MPKLDPYVIQYLVKTKVITATSDFVETLEAIYYQELARWLKTLDTYEVADYLGSEPYLIRLHRYKEDLSLSDYCIELLYILGEEYHSYSHDGDYPLEFDKPVIRYLKETLTPIEYTKIMLTYKQIRKAQNELSI